MDRRYAIRFRAGMQGASNEGRMKLHSGARTYLMASGHASPRLLGAWTAPSAHLARKCARLLCLKGFDIVRVDHA